MFGRLYPQRSTIANYEELNPVETAQLLQGDGNAPSGPPSGPNGTVPAACTNPKEVTSACLRQLYGTYDYTPRVPQRNSLALTGYLNEYAQYDDLAQFLQLERPDQANYTFKTVSVAGGVNPQGLNSSQVSAGTGIEANLDTQTAAGFTGVANLHVHRGWCQADGCRLSAPTRNIFYSTPGSPPFKADRESCSDLQGMHN